MNALEELRSAFMMFYIENQIPDSEEIIIRVTHDFRVRVLHCDVRVDLWQECGGRNPKERLFGCIFESVRTGEINGDYVFIRGNEGLGYTTDFLTNPPQRGE